MKTLIWAGSTRPDSLNFKIGKRISLEPLPTDFQLREFSRDQIPIFSEELEEKNFPAVIESLGSAIRESDALIIVSPEYNGGISGALKNAIDWLSRLDEPVFSKKPILLLAASPGALGGIRALTHSRIIYANLGAHVYSEVIAIPKANLEIEQPNPKTWERIFKITNDFLDFAKRLSEKS